MSEWQPMDTAPTDRPFLAARYQPTSWVYHVVDIDPRRFMSERHRAMNLEWCRAWMERPAPPPHKESTDE